MSKNANLPAVNQINLFTSSANIQTEKVLEIEEVLKQAKRIKITGADGFSFWDIRKRIVGLNEDTLMYIVDSLNFGKPEFRTYENETWHITEKSVEIKGGYEIKILCESIPKKIKLFSNDVTQEI